MYVRLVRDDDLDHYIDLGCGDMDEFFELGCLPGINRAVGLLICGGSGLHLKGIEIQGFKSFGDKAHIEFSPGITAIVGPNGSGKSNVADAVRLGFGGTVRPRALRGAKMEDIIFSGTKERKPLSFCEVVLTFDNADGGLPLEYTEVAVLSRRLYRSGESEYAINRSPCRMRDILSLFYDTGVGRDGYSIIGQGKIEEILSQKGEERRAAFEEAAGVMKYKVNKQEAQRKLANVENSMVRVADIMAELEGNLEPLFQQSQAAREFLELQSRLRELDITLFADQYERNTGRVRKLEEEIQSLERLGAEAKDRETAPPGGGGSPPGKACSDGRPVGDRPGEAVSAGPSGQRRSAGAGACRSAARDIGGDPQPLGGRSGAGIACSWRG